MEEMDILDWAKKLLWLEEGIFFYMERQEYDKAGELIDISNRMVHGHQQIITRTISNSLVSEADQDVVKQMVDSYMKEAYSNH